MQPESLFVECPVPVPHKIHILKYPAVRSASAPNDAAPLPVICVHGLTRMGYDFVDVAQKLSQTRDVYSITMPGRGQSEWFADPLHYIYPIYVADCLHVIQNGLNLEQVDWLGTSMGGLIGMWTASLDGLRAAVPAVDGDAPAREKITPVINRLILNDIGPFLPLSAVQRIALYAGRPLNFATIEEAERHCRAIYADFGIKADKDWRFFAEKTVRPKEGGGYTLHYDTGIAKVFGDVKTDIDVWSLYDAVKCPTLLLRGARSDVLSKEIAQEMTQRGPKAKLVTFENCGHAPALIDPEQIAVVENFIS